MGRSRRHFPFLRRHDPDQVSRVRLHGHLSTVRCSPRNGRMSSGTKPFMSIGSIDFGSSLEVFSGVLSNFQDAACLRCTSHSAFPFHDGDIMNVALPVLPQDRGSREILICFSHLRWHFVFQRPSPSPDPCGQDYEVFYGKSRFSKTLTARVWTVPPSKKVSPFWSPPSAHERTRCVRRSKRSAGKLHCRLSPSPVRSLVLYPWALQFKSAHLRRCGCLRQHG